MSSRRNAVQLVFLLLLVAALFGLPVAAGAAAATPTTSPGITGPAAGATVSGTINVTGYASDPKFLKWELDLLPNGDANAPAFVALGLSQGVFTQTLNTTLFPNGTHLLRLRIVRTDSNYSEFTSKVTFANGALPAATTAPAAATTVVTPAATTAPAAATKVVTPTATTAPAPAATPAPAMAPAANGITSPIANASASGVITVTGNANDPKFMKWELDLLPGGNTSNAATVGLGLAPGAFSQALNTNAYPNGSYVLRLRVVRTDSNYSEYPVSFSISNGAAPAATPAPAVATKVVTPTATTAPAAAATKVVTPTATTAPAAAATKVVTPTATTAPAAAATKVVTPTATTAPAPAATPAPAAAPAANGITSPAANLTVSGVITVTGTANDPKFMKWELDLLPGGNTVNAATVGLGLAPGAFSQALATKAYPNGSYVLRLRIVRTDSNYSEYPVNFSIKN